MDLMKAFLHGDLDSLIYGDDILLVGNDREIIWEVKNQLYSKFDMKDIGAKNFLLGIKVKKDWKNQKLWLNQRKYTETILQRATMQEYK